MRSKKLLVVGNAPIDTDMSKELKDFDYIVRVNRMTNYERCKSKTDLLLLDIYIGSEWSYIASANNSKRFSTVKNVISFTDPPKIVCDKIGITDKAYENMKITSFHDLDIKKYFPNYEYNNHRITNSMWMLLYCIENFSNDYEIWFTCMDVEGRAGLPYLNKHMAHRGAAQDEENFLKTMIANGTIHFLNHRKNGK